MAYGVVLTLPPEAEVWINTIRDSLRPFGVAAPATSDELPARVTLAVCEIAETGALGAWLEAVVEETPRPELRLNALGVFPGEYPLIGFMAVPTWPLVSLHLRLHRELAPFMRERDPFYRPDSWIPHCPLGLSENGDLAAAAAGAPFFGADWAPLVTRGAELALVRLDPPEPLVSHPFID